jgi:hypothetical protein
VLLFVPSVLTAAQRAAVAVVAPVFDNAEQVVVDAFESETVVPTVTPTRSSPD